MERDTTTGRLVSVCITNDDNGREVLRAIVDFHNGDAPDLPFGVIYNATPVCIRLADGEGSGKENGNGQ